MYPVSHDTSAILSGMLRRRQPADAVPRQGTERGAPLLLALQSLLQEPEERSPVDAPV